MHTTLLRDLVTDRTNIQWAQWAQEHPHLAAVVDRIRFVQQAVERLSDDTELEEAIRQADLDEATLASILRVVRLTHRSLGLVLRA